MNSNNTYNFWIGKDYVKMKYLEEYIRLDYKKTDAPDLGQTALLRIYIANTDTEMCEKYLPKRPMVIICPGSGYKREWMCMREAEPVAMKYLARGMNVCILHYATAPDVFPVALLEVLSTIKYLRDKADALYIDKDRIYVCGFSAGGHVAACAGTMWDGKESERYFGDTEYVKPNGLVLCYPVITSGQFAHQGSFGNLLGEWINNKELLDYVSLENRVSDKTPRTFLWHTNGDTSVPAENSLLFALALRRCGVETEIHLFNKGPHGIATADKLTNEDDYSQRMQRWIDMSADWIYEK